MVTRVPRTTASGAVGTAIRGRADVAATTPALHKMHPLRRQPLLRSSRSGTGQMQGNRRESAGRRRRRRPRRQIGSRIRGGRSKQREPLRHRLPRQRSRTPFTVKAAVRPGPDLPRAAPNGARCSGSPRRPQQRHRGDVTQVAPRQARSRKIRTLSGRSRPREAPQPQEVGRRGAVTGPALLRLLGVFEAEAVVHKVGGLSGPVGTIGRKVTTPAAVARTIEAAQVAAARDGVRMHQGHSKVAVAQDGVRMPQGHRKVAVIAGES